MADMNEWKIWNGWGPDAEDGMMRCERIGPRGQGGLIAPSGHDMRGTREDMELAASAPRLRAQVAKLRAALAWALNRPTCEESCCGGSDDTQEYRSACKALEETK
jgi:hypothetical protein